MSLTCLITFNPGTNVHKHISPYGCGRMIPDDFRGCKELLRVYPNYFS